MKYGWLIAILDNIMSLSDSILEYMIDRRS